MTTDFHFLKFLVNRLEISRYDSFNNKLDSEAGVILHLATLVSYMSLMNVKLAELGTMLTTIKLVKSQPEQRRQEYTVFTNDQ